MDRRVGDHRNTVRRIEEVGDVLRDGRDPEIVFASALCDREEERRGVFGAHHPPCLVDHEQSLAELFSHLVPDVVRDDVHSDRLEVVFHVAHGEHDELLIHVDVGWAVHKARPRTLGVFAQTLYERLAPLHTREHEFEVGK